MTLPPSVTALVVAACCALAGGAVAVILRQPRVIGELAAGIAVGPVLVFAGGHGLLTTLLPPTGLPTVRQVGHVGLVLFLISVAHDLKMTRIRGRGAVGVVTGSIVIPLACGGLLAAGILRAGDPDLRGHAPAPAFVLLTAVALAVTAVPVLARILTERSIAHHHVGRQAMSAAIVLDMLCWLLLAVALGLSAGGPVRAVTALAVMAAALTAAFVLRRVLGRPTNSRLAARHPRLAVVVVAACGLLASSGLQSLGLTEIFGALMVGLAIPRDGEGGAWTATARVFGRVGLRLVPLYFVATGAGVFLARDLGNIPWLLTVVVVLLGILGKVGGGYLGARLGGESPATSLRLGVLLNTRGLTELVVLHAGSQAGILTPPLFMALVVMALMTTAMTGPAYALLERRDSSGAGKRPTGERLTLT